MGLGYFLRVCSGATFGKMKDTIAIVKEKSGLSSAHIFFDMVGSMLKYGAGYNDYVIFDFYKLPASERKKYMTRLKNKRFVSMVNDSSLSYIFDHKDQFYIRFKKYLGRETCSISGLSFENFCKFIADKDAVIVKPSAGEGGHGIEKLDKSSFKTLEEFYAYVTDPAHNFGVMDEVLVQHPDISKIYPCSINCLRVVTLVTNGEPHILYAMFKTGNNGHYVDNHCSGGFMCHFDLDKGEVTGPGHTIGLELADVHPYTGVPFKGFKLPFCDKVKELVKSAALEVEQYHYVGWDVCITENGPVIIEGNDYPAYDLYQLPEPGRPSSGFLELVQKYIPDFK